MYIDLHLDKVNIKWKQYPFVPNPVHSEEYCAWSIDPLSVYIIINLSLVIAYIRLYWTSWLEKTVALMTVLLLNRIDTKLVTCSKDSKVPFTVTVTNYKSPSSCVWNQIRSLKTCSVATHELLHLHQHQSSHGDHLVDGRGDTQWWCDLICDLWFNKYKRNIAIWR